MAPTSFSIPRGSWVLVTGANGYIASHVVDTLLGLGFRVRGTIREDKPWLVQFFEEKYGKGKFESVVIPVMEEDDAFDAAMEGVSGVVHLATDVSMNANPHTVIANVKQATTNALVAATKHKSIKRFVLTSSSSAAIIPKPNVKGITIDKSTWNDEAVSAAWNNSAPEGQQGYYVYAASKTEGERAAWKWVAEEKPQFVLNTVLPNANRLTILLEYYVDVGDCARLHVSALLDSSVENERIFAFAREFNWTDVISILRKLRPGRELPDPPENEGRDYTVVVPQKRAEALLKSFFGQSGWTDMEQSLAEGIEDI
ncbi:NAD(P)-binding protein, partial [Thozetella sp. PMI_491]